MQLKGLVKFFTAALILISLYQLSFTFVVKNVENWAHRKAKETAGPGAPDSVVNAKYDKITDSLQGEVVYSVPLLNKFTYMETKEQELNLGLDLQGGMNVTLEVSLAELVSSMSNNPEDPALKQAIAAANKAKANSQADFVTLFGQQYLKANPGARLASLFTKPSEKDITITSTNEQVLAKISAESKEAIKRTHKVLLTRIDKFGVANPNVNLDVNKGTITVELAGVRDPERVRNILQATASLEFYEVYNDPKFMDGFTAADESLEKYLASDGTVMVKDTNDVTRDTTGNMTAAVADTTPDTSAGLSSLMNDKNATGKDSATLAKTKNPLRTLLSAQPNEKSYDIAAVGYIYKKDVEKFFEYLALDVVKNKMPSKMKFLLGTEKDKRKNPNAAIPVYAVRTTTEGGAKLDGSVVTRASKAPDQLRGGWEINMAMNSTGSKIWKKLTGENVGNYVAVVLDERVYSAPRIQGEIDGGSTAITGDFSVEEAEDLANILNTGKLPAPANIVQEQVVGPTLGAESINSGFTAIILSFIAIFLLMVVYYNTSGMVANISLTLNLLFTIGVLTALHATLTLPGIAGLVLGIGMAVDAHVLIFERIKEELAIGKTHHQAVIDGYRRSNAPVLDGHIAQLITAVILFSFGLGPVLGFATTQILSITISLFCGILVSRLIKEMYMKSGRQFKYFTSVSRAVFQKANFDFMRSRKVTYGIFFVVILLGVVSLFNGFDYGVEFAGGRSYTVKFDKPHEVTAIRDKMEGYFKEYPIVKTIGTDNQINITTAYLITEPGKEAEQAVQHKLYEGLKNEGFLPANVSESDFANNYVQSSQTVLPTISDDLKDGAKMATIFSLLAISAYILIRFRKWQYSLGTFASLFFNICATLAIFSFLRGRVPFALEIDQHFIAAVLTVIGFSMNDTIIVFDRVREYFRKSAGEDRKSVINRAINDTLPRTVMTSLTVFLVVLILFIVGGEVTRGFAFAMLIGVITGTYSSIFVAGPILVDLDKQDSLKAEVNREAHIEELKKMA